MTEKNKRIEIDRDNTRKPKWRQSRLRDYTAEADKCIHPNIPPFGDPLKPRREEDGIFRAGLQNVRGASKMRGLKIAHEIDAMDELGIDVQGFGETS